MVSLSVTNMMCEQGCASHVKDLLASAPGVNSAEVDFAKKSATLEVGTGFDESKTLAMLEKAGYPSSLATPQ
jgi:mercuric reductase